MKLRVCSWLTRFCKLWNDYSSQTVDSLQEHQGWFVAVAYPLVDTRDGHILGVATAMAMAELTGRMDLCVAGLFGAGKSRAAAVMLVGMLMPVQL